MTKPDREMLQRRLERLEALVESDPADASGWYGLGRALAGLERHDDAAGAFRKALEANIEYSAAHRELGRCLATLGEHAQAIAAFEAGIAVAERNGDLQTAREMRTLAKRAARILRAAAEPADPEAAAEREAASETPSTAERPTYTDAMSEARALYKQGFDSFVKGEDDEAIGLYRRALEAEPELAIAWNGLSMALARKGEMDEAVAAARRLVELEPEDALSHTNLSRLLMQAGKIPEAEDARAQAMQLQMKQGGR